MKIPDTALNGLYWLRTRLKKTCLSCVFTAADKLIKIPARYPYHARTELTEHDIAAIAKQVNALLAYNYSHERERLGATTPTTQYGDNEQFHYGLPTDNR